MQTIKRIVRDPFALFAGIAIGAALAFLFPVVKFAAGIAVIALIVLAAYLAYVRGFDNVRNR